ncbi:uncharacterized protein LOC132272377 [Cornus florida]|uniref:uncharacterized protein LOC132272377 n=1 Tax=Cornus florida TaxID=4283 RepID=UPI0028A1A61D|nr:uncharacterized protein LOC132272377 [Cornus florida]
MRFGKKWKLSPCLVGPFMITDLVGAVTYSLALLDHLYHTHNVFPVSILWKFLCDKDRYQHIDVGEIELQPDATHVEPPYRILDRRNQVLCIKIIPLVRVQWIHHNEAESTWEREDEIHSKFPKLLK